MASIYRHCPLPPIPGETTTTMALTKNTRQAPRKRRTSEMPDSAFIQTPDGFIEKQFLSLENSQPYSESESRSHTLSRSRSRSHSVSVSISRPSTESWSLPSSSSSSLSTSTPSHTPSSLACTASHPFTHSMSESMLPTVPPLASSFTISTPVSVPASVSTSILNTANTKNIPDADKNRGRKRAQKKQQRRKQTPTQKRKRKRVRKRVRVRKISRTQPQPQPQTRTATQLLKPVRAKTRRSKTPPRVRRLTTQNNSPAPAIKPSEKNKTPVPERALLRMRNRRLKPSCFNLGATVVDIQQSHLDTNEESFKVVKKMLRELGLQNVRLGYQIQGSCVFKGERADVRENAPNFNCVLKVLHLHRIDVLSSQTAMEMVTREVEIYKRTADSPYIVNMYQAHFNNVHGTMVIVLEHAPYQDLRILMSKYRAGLREDKAFAIFENIVTAVSFMHTHKLAHRDIKLENILIFTDRCKLCDLGFACDLDDIGHNAHRRAIASNMCGTVEYISYTMAARLKHRRDYTETEAETNADADADEWAREHNINWNPMKSDVWALGVVLVMLLSGSLPYLPKGGSVWDMERAILHTPLFLSSAHSLDVRDLVHKMLCRNEEERFNIREVRKHAWMQRKTSRSTHTLPLSAQRRASLRVDAKYLHHSVSDENVRVKF